jgi:hypothetical protein
MDYSSFSLTDWDAFSVNDWAGFLLDPAQSYQLISAALFIEGISAGTVFDIGSSAGAVSIVETIAAGTVGITVSAGSVGIVEGITAGTVAI